MTEFKLPILTSIIAELVENATEDNQNKSCKRLQGDYSRAFVKGIIDNGLKNDRDK